MNFVLDASLTMAFVFSDEATAETDAILDTFGQGVKALSPGLWRWEVGNVLLMAERRKRITEAENHRHLASLQKLPVEVDEESWREAWSRVAPLARKHGLKFYDTVYLELAIRRDLALGSLDVELRKAAEAEGIRVLPEAL
jgi:predicted nucleic acid-binding protein